jgi:hypothetical protein
MFMKNNGNEREKKSGIAEKRKNAYICKLKRLCTAGWPVGHGE